MHNIHRKGCLIILSINRLMKGNIMKLTVEQVPPDISEDERKHNLENFYNTLFRVNKMKNFSHCDYNSDTNTVHVILTKSRS